MSPSISRVAVGVLALSAMFVGAWAQVAPHGFYSSFPLPSHPWVAVDGVYVEHLTRDVGGLYLGFFVMSTWAFAHPSTEALRMVGWGWLVFSVPHLLFHVGHLDEFGTVDKIGNVVTLGGTTVLALLLVLTRTATEPRR